MFFRSERGWELGFVDFEQGEVGGKLKLNGGHVDEDKAEGDCFGDDRFLEDCANMARSGGREDGGGWQGGQGLFT